MRRDDYTTEQRYVRAHLARMIRVARGQPSSMGYDPESVAFGVWSAACQTEALRANEFYGRNAIPFLVSRTLRARAERRQKETA